MLVSGDIRILGYDTSYLESISKKTMYLEAHRPSMMMERVSANRKTSIDLFFNEKLENVSGINKSYRAHFEI